MNFEDCRKMMLKRLTGEITAEELMTWSAKHCTHCEERVCHCEECPMLIQGDCRFGV